MFSELGQYSRNQHKLHYFMNVGYCYSYGCYLLNNYYYVVHANTKLTTYTWIALKIAVSTLLHSFHWSLTYDTIFNTRQRYFCNPFNQVNRPTLKNTRLYLRLVSGVCQTKSVTFFNKERK